MSSRSVNVLCFALAVFCIRMAAQTEPTLIAVNIPKYPPLARAARIAGEVKLTFTLPANGKQPANVEVVSGHPMLKEAAIDNVKTWKFENRNSVDRKYETTFRYRLSGLEVPFPKAATVTFESFHQVDIVTDIPQPLILN